MVMSSWTCGVFLLAHSGTDVAREKYMCPSDLRPLPMHLVGSTCPRVNLQLALTVLC
jgi:hypothetical protein